MNNITAYIKNRIGLLLLGLSVNAFCATPFQWCYSQGDCASTPEAVCSTSAFGFTNSSGFYDPRMVCSRAYSGIVEFDEYGPVKALCNITTNPSGDCGDSEGTILNHSRTIGRNGTCSAGNRINSVGQCEKECKPPYSFSPSENECVKYCPPSTPTLSASSGQCGNPDDTPPPNECTAGNPVVISTGEKIQVERPDYEGNKPFPLLYQRSYRSHRAPEADPLFSLADRYQVVGSSIPQINLEGWTRYVQPPNYEGPAAFVRKIWRETAPVAGYKQWHHNYQYAPLLGSDGDELTLERPTGHSLRFKRSGSDYIATNLSGDRVTPANGGGWVYQPEPGLTEIYNSDGLLTRLEKNSTVYQTLSYNEQGLLESVTHNLGGSIGFTYTQDNAQKLDTVTLPNGSTLKHQYDELGNLTHVVRSFMNAAGLPKTHTRQYHYEDVYHPYALTGITDERNVRYASWKYDELGRAIESRHGEGDVDKTTFEYQGENATVVTNALNKQTIYHYSQESGVKRLQTVEGVATTNCAAANKAYTYDARGFVAIKTDWKGNTTIYNSRDSEGRELSRTDAAGTSQQRIIETEWHPDFDLPTKIIEPERVTTFTYDTSGRLLTKTITPRVTP